MQLAALLRLGFPTAPDLQVLNLAAYHNSLARSTKSTRSLALPSLVSIRFQFLFHSPPGVLFTFPSRYYSLSVTWSYLALRDGPRIFRQNSSCSDVLVVSALKSFRLQDCHFLLSGFPTCSAKISSASDTRAVFLQLLWALPFSLATTHGIVFTFFSSGY